MAGWMKTPLGTEVNLGQGHVVLDGTQFAPVKGAQLPPVFGHVYCGHGRPSQLLLSSCLDDVTIISNDTNNWLVLFSVRRDGNQV